MGGEWVVVVVSDSDVGGAWPGFHDLCVSGANGRRRAVNSLQRRAVKVLMSGSQRLGVKTTIC